jgi:hypothetical protein
MSNLSHRLEFLLVRGRSVRDQPPTERAIDKRQSATWLLRSNKGEGVGL